MLLRLTDEELVQHICGSSDEREKALSYLYDTASWRNDALRQLKLKGVAPNDALDAVHEAFIVFDNHVRLGKYDASKGTLKSYFLGICQGRQFVAKRSQKRIDAETEVEKLVLPFYQNPESEFLDTEIKQVVNHLLRLLDERCHTLLKQYMLDFSMKEIGALMNIEKVTAVAKAAFDCRLKFKNLIQKSPYLKKYFNLKE